MNPPHLLILNATLQLLVSSLLGVLLLIPMQPWGKRFLQNVKSLPDLRSTHIDWLLLALMQFGIAFALLQKPIHSQRIVAYLVIFGGWMNATPYLVRGLWGINGFSLTGSPKQKAFAALGLISVTSLITAFVIILLSWLF